MRTGASLDALSSLGTIFFDKTGTLTTGRLACTSMQSLDSAALAFDQGGCSHLPHLCHLQTAVAANQTQVLQRV